MTFAPVPPPKFLLSPLGYDFKADRWYMMIEFDPNHYDCYFNVHKSCNGIEAVVAKRNPVGDIVGAKIILKREYDRHVAYIEIYRAFDYLLTEN